MYSNTTLDILDYIDVFMYGVPRNLYYSDITNKLRILIEVIYILCRFIVNQFCNCTCYVSQLIIFISSEKLIVKCQYKRCDPCKPKVAQGGYSKARAKQYKTSSGR